MQAPFLSLLLLSIAPLAWAEPPAAAAQDAAPFWKEQVFSLPMETASDGDLRLTAADRIKLGIDRGVTQTDWLGESDGSRPAPDVSLRNAHVPPQDAKTNAESMRLRWGWVPDKAGGSWKKSSFNFNIGYQF